MNRRQMMAFGLAAVAAGPSIASGFEDEVMASLRAQGYQNISVEITLLGRVKITAFKQSNRREIVINPRTGEILRDLWLTADGRVATNAPVFDDLDLNDKITGGSGDGGSHEGSDGDAQDNGGSNSGGSGNSGSGGSDDDDSDDEPEDGSGRGSGGGRE